MPEPDRHSIQLANAFDSSVRRGTPQTALHSDLLDGLPPEELMTVENRLTTTTLIAGAKLLTQGEWLGVLYILRGGVLSVDVDLGDGRTRHLGSLVPGDCAGEMSLLTGAAISASVTAVVDVELWELHYSDFVELLTTCPSFARNVSVILSRRLSVTNLGPKPGLARLMRLRVHPALQGGLAEDLARMVAKHMARPLLVLDTRATHKWQSDERGGELEAEIGSADLLERLDPARSAAVFVLKSDCVSTETWTRLGIWIFDRLTHMLVVTEAFTSPAFLRSGGDPAVDLTLLPAGEKRVPPDAEDVALVGSHDLGNTRGSVERAREVYAAKVVRFVDTNGGRSSDDVAWLARHLAGMKVGLALGAGGIRGFAHIGVLLRLQQAKVPVDYVVGCSVGGLIAAGCATGMTAETMLRESANFSSQTMKFTLSRRSLLSSRGLAHMYHDRLFGDGLIEDAGIPLAIVAVDVMNHVEIVLERGLIWRAVLATTALPGVYPPVRIHNRWLVDGGLLDPVPAGVVRALGADVVLSINLGGLRGHTPVSLTADDLPSTDSSPHAVDILMRSFDIMGNRITARVIEDADVTLVANIEPMGLRDFHRVPDLVEAGQRAVQPSWSQVQALLPWLPDA